MDFRNVWGLVLIGAGLIVGLFTRPAITAGMVLLGFYYLLFPTWKSVGLDRFVYKSK